MLQTVARAAVPNLPAAMSAFAAFPPSGESWEDSSLQKIYEARGILTMRCSVRTLWTLTKELLVKLLDGPEHDPYDLPTLQRLKETTPAVLQELL